MVAARSGTRRTGQFEDEGEFLLAYDVGLLERVLIVQRKGAWLQIGVEFEVAGLLLEDVRDFLLQYVYGVTTLDVYEHCLVLPFDADVVHALRHCSPALTDTTRTMAAVGLSTLLLVSLLLPLARSEDEAGGGKCGDNLSRLEREEALWRARCAAPGTAGETHWKRITRLYAQARSGGPARVLVLANMRYAQGLGNTMELLSAAFMHGLVTGRAVFLNASSPEKVQNLRQRVPRFDPAAHLVGLDGVDWSLRGAEGLELVRQWAASGMREEVFINKGCQQTIPPAETDKVKGHGPGPWITISGGSCYSRISVAAQKTANAPARKWATTCLVHAMTRPRPQVATAIRSILRLHARACSPHPGDCTGAPPLVALHVRTGWADGMDVFGVSKLGSRDPREALQQAVSWEDVERGFATNLRDRLGLSVRRGLPRKAPVVTGSSFNWTCTDESGGTLFGGGHLLDDFGGFQRLSTCARVLARKPALVPSVVVSQLPSWRTTLVEDGCTRQEIRRVATEGACACANGAFYAAGDSAHLLDLMRRSYGDVVITSESALGKGPQLHTGMDLVHHSAMVAVSLQVAAEAATPDARGEGCADAVSCAFVAAHTRAVVDWYMMSIADFVFSVGAHMRSTFVPTALARSTVPRGHLEYFDAIPKFACASRGLCSRPLAVRGTFQPVCLGSSRKRRAYGALFEACRAVGLEGGAPATATPEAGALRTYAGV